MIFYIKDYLEYEWAYDTNKCRFYLNEKEVEEELGDENGYFANFKDLDFHLNGYYAVMEFNQDRVEYFLEEIRTFLDWEEEFKSRTEDMNV